MTAGEKGRGRQGVKIPLAKSVQMPHKSSLEKGLRLSQKVRGSLRATPMMPARASPVPKAPPRRARPRASTTARAKARSERGLSEGMLST